MFGVVFDCLECAACGQPGASYFAVSSNDYVHGRNLEGVQVYHPSCVTKEYHAETSAENQFRNRATIRGSRLRVQTGRPDSFRGAGHYGAPTEPRSLVLRMRLPSGYSYKSATLSLRGLPSAGPGLQRNYIWKGNCD